MSSANREAVSAARSARLGDWWRSSTLRIALISGLSMWLLNSLLVLGLYDFTLRALVGDIGRSIDAKIEKRLAAWPRQLPQHAGVTTWLYRQLAVEIADLQDCTALLDSDGELQLSNINHGDRPEFRYRQYYTATFTGHRWQHNGASEGASCLVTERVLTDGGKLIYGVPFDSYLLTIQQLNKLRIWGLLITAALSLLVTLSITLRQLRRLRVIHEACERVASGDLKQRIVVSGRDDDLDHIAAVINHMLDQIAQLMEGVREVSDAIAHDLKTPLARLRGQLELLLSIPERSDDAIDAVIAEADQVLSAFNALLRIAQLEQGTRRQAFIHFDFNSVLAQMREIYEVVFADKNIQFDIDAAPNGAPAYGDRDLWLQACSNLLDNAYKYTPAGGRVAIALAIEGPALHLRISDSGPGIPSNEHANVFKRFYRLDKHRSQKGTGLGLSLVAAVCKVHRATIELGNAGGLVIDIRIPVDIHADDSPTA